LPFRVRALPADGPGRLFVMGLVTDLLNPKIAFMYVTLLPQFISPDHGSVLVQSLGPIRPSARGSMR
jgi:threonine/homoserine/homoserine lactone efflux protein